MNEEEKDEFDFVEDTYGLGLLVVAIGGIAGAFIACRGLVWIVEWFSGLF